MIVESLIYSSGQMLLGLLLHPYRSMQLLVKSKVLLPYVFYPVLIACLLLLLLRINLFFNLLQSVFLFRFLYQTMLFYCFYWQLALFYLWLRFSRAFYRL